MITVGTISTSEILDRTRTIVVPPGMWVALSPDGNTYLGSAKTVEDAKAIEGCGYAMLVTSGFPPENR